MVRLITLGEEKTNISKQKPCFLLFLDSIKNEREQLLGVGVELKVLPEKK